MHRGQVHQIHRGAARSETAARRLTRNGPRDPESAFRQLLELVPDAALLGDVDGRCNDANSAACRLLGRTRDELVGMTFGDFTGPEEATTVPKRPFPPGLTFSGQFHAKLKDGTVVLFEVRCKVLPDGRTLSILRDITERKRAEREREESLRWMRAVLEQSPVALALVKNDPNGNTWEPNGRAQQVTGIDPRDVKPVVLEDLRRRFAAVNGQNGHALEPEEFPAARALRGETVVGAEYRMPHTSGSLNWTAIHAAPVVGSDGTVLGAVIAVEDISARKELERLRAEWSSVVAHDLRQPLVVISLGTDALARSAHDPSLLKRLERISAAAARLQRMVGDLMDLSRLEASRLELVRHRVDLAALVHAAAEQARLQAPGRLIEVRASGEVPDVDADPDRVTQVLENLLTNAIKYGKAATPVAMTVARDGGEVAVAVINEGRALTPEEIAQIFRRFQRTESAKLEGIEGVGLGLYIARSLIEAHGGRITAESTPEGVTTFRFTLPTMKA